MNAPCPTCSTAEYEKFLQESKWYAHADQTDTGELAYHALGLAGEGGEFVDLVKKVVRDHGYDLSLSNLSTTLIDMLRDELGDVLWYLTQEAKLLDLTLPQLMQLNMDKIKAREAPGGAGRKHVR